MKPRRPPLPTRRSVSISVLALTLAMTAGACGSVTEEAFSSEPPSVADDASTDASTEGGGATAIGPDPGCDANRPDASLAPGGSVDELLADGTVGGSGRLAEIREAGILRAGVGVDTLQFGSVRDGQIQGFDVDIASLVADRLGVGLELIPVQSAERIEAIRSGRVDLVVKTMTITCERWAQVNFSSAYYQAGQRVLLSTDDDLVPNTLEDLTEPTANGEPRRLCVAPGTTSEANLLEAGVSIINAPTWTGCLVAMQLGRADGVSTDDTILSGLAVQDPTTRVVGAAFSDEPYGVALPPDDPGFTRFVNAVLEEARTDGTWRALYDEWLADVLGPSTSVPAARYRS